MNFILAALETKEKIEKKLPEGLTSEEAARLANEGFANVSDTKSGKSYLKIITDNLFTFFNMVWAIVAVVLVCFGSFKNLTFLAVVIPNTLIAIIQEIRAKITVEKLSVATDPKAFAIRDGVLTEIDSKDIVLGDVIYVESGRQILADGTVISGIAEANESMLTGESLPIKKTEGDRVLAGSYLVSGGVYVKVTEVGKDTYLHSIEKAAKNFKAPSSNLFRDLNKLIKYIGILMIPMTALVFLNNWFSPELGGDIVKVVEKTSGAIIGMIPAGVYLLITLTLTLGVITLAKKDTLVQDMYSIEMLAAADVVCLDKTGTITDGTMTVSSFMPLSDVPEEQICRIMAIIEGSEPSINNTSAALIEKFGKDESAEIIDKIPFSSSRKYSSVLIEGEGAYSIGAPGFVKCPVSEELKNTVELHAQNGERVLLLVKQPALEEVGEAIALIAITDRIRNNAKETIAKFQEQGVTVKVISGDHAATVSNIAKRVGITNAECYISCDGLSDEELVDAADKYAVFGRVTPEQKVLLVKTLRAAGHTVAMTGDGVNDTLALKESDCSIAMAEGSDAAKRVSKIVLMKSDFGALPEVVKEGRRCINNVRMSAVLFLMKTLLTIALSVVTIVTVTAYPFEPNQLMFLELLVIGFASLMLTVEPNARRIEGSFIKTVLIKSIPKGLAMLVPIIVGIILLKAGVITSPQFSAISTFAVTLTGYVNLLFLCKPYTKWRVWVVILTAVFLCILIPASIFIVSDMAQLLPAFGNLPVLFATAGVSVSISVIVHLCLLIMGGKKKNS